MKQKEADDFLEYIRLNLSRKLHRPLVYKKSSAKYFDYFLFDPIIKYLAHRRRDYRSGFRLIIEKDCIKISFCTMYNKNIFKNILSNFNDKVQFSNHINDIGKSKNVFIGWSSKKGKRVIFFDDINDLEDPKNIYNDLGFKTTEDQIKGSYFEIGFVLSKNSSNKIILQYFNLFIPFFNAQFPTSFTEGREGNFRRSLEKRYKDSKLKMECAFKGCNSTTNLEAAHIVPHKFRKDNRTKNGIFLCHKHHRFNQEGKSKADQNKMLKVSHIKNTVIK